MKHIFKKAAPIATASTIAAAYAGWGITMWHCHKWNKEHGIKENASWISYPNEPTKDENISFRNHHQ